MIFETDKWLFDLSEDYSQLFQQCNWYTFRFLKFEVEDTAALGCCEVMIAFLGIGLRISYNYEPDTELRQEIDATLKRLDLD